MTSEARWISKDELKKNDPEFMSFILQVTHQEGFYNPQTQLSSCRIDLVVAY